MISDRVSDYKEAIQLSRVLIMPALQAMAIRLYVEAERVAQTRRLLEESIIKPFQRDFGPHAPTFSDLAMLEIPYKRLPQFMQFNAFLSDIVSELVSKELSTTGIAYAMIMVVMKIATRTVHSAVGVKEVMRSSRDLDAGLYNVFAS